MAGKQRTAANDQGRGMDPRGGRAPVVEALEEEEGLEEELLVEA